MTSRSDEWADFVKRIRSLVDARFRRAYRSLRYLPRIEYRRVIDAGASRGSFADAVLQIHQPERLVLVEAIPGLASQLEANFARHAGVSVVSAALSDRSGNADFEVNEFDYASSLLRIDPRNNEWYGRSLNVAKRITVPTLSLPDLLSQEGLNGVDLLKLDLQGGERLALTGGESVLNRIRVIYSEVFFEKLYDGSWLFWDFNEFLSKHRFKLCGLANIKHSRSGDLLQADATFRHTDVSP